MKKFILIIALLFIAGCASPVHQEKVSKSKRATSLVDGKLAPCPKSPNCEFRSYSLKSNIIESRWHQLQKAIRSTGGSIHTAKNNYIAATYTSKLFGFVDDVEASLDLANRQIHIRSASRVGYSDLGANKKRLANIESAWRINR